MTVSHSVICSIQFNRSLSDCDPICQLSFHNCSSKYYCDQRQNMLKHKDMWLYHWATILHLRTEWNNKLYFDGRHFKFGGIFWSNQLNNIWALIYSEMTIIKKLCWFNSHIIFVEYICIYTGILFKQDHNIFLANYHNIHLYLGLSPPNLIYHMLYS